MATWIEKIRLKPTEYKTRLICQLVREIVQQLSPVNITDTTLRHFVNIAKSEIFNRLKLWTNPYYRIIFTMNHGDVDANLGLYVLTPPATADVYNEIDVKIATMNLFTNIIDVISLSYENYGAGHKTSLEDLLHFKNSQNDMYVKEMYWAYSMGKIYIYNGKESVKVSSTVDGEFIQDSLTMHLIPATDTKVFSHTADRKALDYYIEAVRGIMLDNITDTTGDTVDVPVDLPPEYIRLLISVTQKLCLENLTGKTDPNLSMMVENQFMSFINQGVQNVQNS